MKILTVYTGGTICSFENEHCRSLDGKKAKRLLESRFFSQKEQHGIFDDIEFDDSGFENQTLSENMTEERLFEIADHIRNVQKGEYSGIIVLHGTDTLAFTASFLSFVLSDIKSPLILVSAQKPVLEADSNADINFAEAVRLIAKGIPANVYVVYRNSDNRTLLHLGSSIMQCKNFSDDFESASQDKVFELSKLSDFEKLTLFSEKRVKIPQNKKLCGRVVGIIPYTGLDYKRISLENVSIIVHGTYHSGTVCAERSVKNGKFSSASVLFLAEKCKKRKIPVFAAPSKLSKEQYSSMLDAVENGGVIPLDMTFESAYGKALAAKFLGVESKKTIDFMNEEVCGELIK